jgi:hypothetical protein
MANETASVDGARRRIGAEISVKAGVGGKMPASPQVTA